MIKAIIFDCFGVLAHDGWTPLKRTHIEPNSPMERAVAELGRQSDVGTISPANTITRISEAMGIGEEVLRSALNGKVPNIELFEYINQDLKAKYKIGLMSNANYDVLHELFTPEQAAVFDATVMSYDSNLAKPDRRMYELMVERLGVELKDCIFVDDQERHVVSARNYGSSAVWYQSLDQFKTELQKYL